MNTLLSYNRSLKLFAMILTAIALSGSIFAQSVASKSQNRPNIIFIMADELGYGDLGSYGQKVIKTPHIDKLAEDGLRFTQCYAGATVCAPSRSVLMTGKHTGQTTGRNSAITVAPYYGPSMVTGTEPEDGNSISDSELTLRWSEADGAVSYNVYISEDANALRAASMESASFVGNITETSWQLSNPEKGKAYFWAIDAVGKKGIRKGEINSVIYGYPTSGNDNKNNEIGLEYELRQGLSHQQ